MTAATNLPWRGAETVATARAMLARHHDVELQLPAGYHHAVLTHFQARAVAEHVDVAGGSELLKELARIHGLDQLADLEAAVDRTHARVRVVSPSPIVVISMAPEAGGDAL